MTTYIALLRAVNVGGTGLLSMQTLRTICAEHGLNNVRTYIQSGNVLFDSPRSEDDLRTGLEDAIAKRTGRPVGVSIRTASELTTALKANPFPDAKPSQVAVVFLTAHAPADAIQGLVIPGREEVRPVGREIFVHYPDGMGRSKLKLPFAANATTRNLNTVTRLVALARTFT